ncbi:magnesium and cobalt transport protein CorA [Coraliomargarita sinensis]|uniref:Magnesium transport protein CorA n=1 Tax=Coraliomargarita sinensis TaxID=2174842 RepID=A0A317ZDZ2_9BACT|nr:magnesium/cobalt transporter CorA [Coraliomargarita sinensis]PXA03360.1 magnesium and cobalt transport protein CorA [Coraliomargarita sinensis]
MPVRKSFESAKEVASATSDVIAKTAGFFASTFVGIGRGIFQPLTNSTAVAPRAEPGAAPGIEQYLQAEDSSFTVSVSIIDYGEGYTEHHEFENIDDALHHPKPEKPHVRWININGLKPSAVDTVCKQYGFHTLSAEDVINTYQRPKLEVFDDHYFVVARQIQLVEDRLKNEQISFFLTRDTLISFQEVEGDVFDPVRRRLENKTGRFRIYKTDYLFYALLDSIVDHLFPLLEGYGAALEDLEYEILQNPVPELQQQLFAVKRDLSLLRRALWPLREVVDQLYRDESDIIHRDLKSFYRDVQDHSIQVIDLLETCRETASSLSDLYQSAVGNKMNETMKVLTIMASFFIPITFVAGVYGMNFEHIPELSWPYAYAAFWSVCISITAALAVYFWRKGWIGK